jgi:hypothetical protein
VFPTVTVGIVAGTIAWPVGIDFDSDVLHGRERPAIGLARTMLGEFHRQPTR